MKNLTLILALQLLFFLQVFAENDGLSFQGIARNGSGDALSGQTINIRFSIGVKNLDPDFIEEHTGINTDAFGVFSAIIGSKDVANFNNVDFSKNLMLKVEVKTASSSNYVEISNSQITKVPVAMYAQQAFFPAGMIIPFAGPKTKIPTGWILCDGRALDTDAIEYKNLYAAIGYAWGKDGNFFRVPDLRGMFLRGVTGDRTDIKDPNADSRDAVNGGNAGNNIGSVQSSAYKAHNHTINNGGEHSHTYKMTNHDAWAAASAFHTWGLYQRATDFSTSADGNHSHSMNNGNGASAESRPVNAYVNYIIKL